MLLEWRCSSSTLGEIFRGTINPELRPRAATRTTSHFTKSQTLWQTNRKHSTNSVVATSYCLTPQFLPRHVIARGMPNAAHRAPARALSILTRVLELSCVLVVVTWVVKLGGVSMRPAWSSETTNDTGRLFNVHPLLQTAAFAVLMAEALQAWRSPIVPGLGRRVPRATPALCPDACAGTWVDGWMREFLKTLKNCMSSN